MYGVLSNLVSLFFHPFSCAVEDLPELGEILQQYIDDNIRQIDISGRIERDHGVKMG